MTSFSNRRNEDLLSMKILEEVQAVKLSLEVVNVKYGGIEKEIAVINDSMKSFQKVKLYGLISISFFCGLGFILLLVNDVELLKSILNGFIKLI